MPKGSRRIRMNRAVGLFRKMDEFDASPEQYDSLVGAGYADAVLEPERPHEGTANFTMDVLTGGDERGDPVPGESDNDADRAA